MDVTEPGDTPWAAPIASGMVPLPDARFIAWTAWGNPVGTTIINQPHVGDSGQRVLAVDVAPLADAGIRLVIVCRAGLGRSTGRSGRTELTDAEDMLQIVDALGLDRVPVLGECGGTGASLAMAAQWPDRVSGIALLSPLAPLAGRDANGYTSRRQRSMRQSLRFGPIARWVARSNVRAFARDPEGFVGRGLHALPAVDRSFLEDPTRRAHALASSSDFYSSAERFLDEWRTTLGPWRFDLSAVRAPVMIDHGALDMSAPVEMARWLASRLPSAELTIDPDRGHFIEPAGIAGILKRLPALGSLL
jgi:pimeloyl-ACP methyl ester carboxylesterase